MSRNSARQDIQELAANGTMTESDTFQAALDRLETAVMRATAARLVAEFGVTNRAVGAVRRWACELDGEL